MRTIPLSLSVMAVRRPDLRVVRNHSEQRLNTSNRLHRKFAVTYLLSTPSLCVSRRCSLSVVSVSLHGTCTYHPYLTARPARLWTRYVSATSVLIQASLTLCTASRLLHSQVWCSPLYASERLNSDHLASRSPSGHHSARTSPPW